MARQNSYELYDRILGGQLSDLIAGWRGEGLSLEDIAYQLRDRDIHTSANTVGRWIKEQCIVPKAPAA